jgi:hypothetical protein
MNDFSRVHPLWTRVRAAYLHRVELLAPTLKWGDRWLAEDWQQCCQAWPGQPALAADKMGVAQIWAAHSGAKTCWERLCARAFQEERSLLKSLLGALRDRGVYGLRGRLSCSQMAEARPKVLDVLRWVPWTGPSNGIDGAWDVRPTATIEKLRDALEAVLPIHFIEWEGGERGGPNATPWA